ncbi:hypothetical protein [Mycolicibacterium sp. XJ1819]
MTRVATVRLLVLVALGTLLAAGVKVAPAHAMPLDAVVATIRDAHGHYAPRSASLKAADCSGLVSVAQSLAMGQPIRRLGNTRSLLAGKWPHAIRGASQDDLFVIGSSRTHMSVRVGGVNLEARQSGEPFLIGPQARDPFTFPTVWHIDPKVIAS